MKTACIVLLALGTGVAGRADFSYTTTRKPANAAAGAPEQSSRHFYKGQKMLVDDGRTETLMDFDAQTITRINNKDKTYSVMKFADLGDKVKNSDMDLKVDVKNTGQTKTVNGYEAHEVVLTMNMDAPDNRPGAPKMQMQMEMDMWISSHVPGGSELRAFYAKNRDLFPWKALAGGQPGMQKAMVDLQRKIAELDGVPVQQVVKIKSAGGAQSDQMAQARAKLEELQKQGGPGAAMAAQALARMGGASGGGSMFETTIDFAGFSTATVADSVFAIPAGYTKTEK